MAKQCLSATLRCRSTVARLTLLSAAITAALAMPWAPAQAQTTLNGTQFSVQGLVGVGRLAANLRDEHGETFGSVSGLWANSASWARSGNTYTGSFLAAPDRGYNIAGTIDYAPRLNTLQMVFTPAAVGASQDGAAGFPKGAPVPPPSAPSAAPTTVPPPGLLSN